jgi:hypothetical protein
LNVVLLFSTQNQANILFDILHLIAFIELLVYYIVDSYIDIFQVPQSLLQILFHALVQLPKPYIVSYRVFISVFPHSIINFFDQWLYFTIFEAMLMNLLEISLLNFWLLIKLLF